MDDFRENDNRRVEDYRILSLEKSQMVLRKDMKEAAESTNIIKGKLNILILVMIFFCSIIGGGTYFSYTDLKSHIKTYNEDKLEIVKEIIKLERDYKRDMKTLINNSFMMHDQNTDKILKESIMSVDNDVYLLKNLLNEDITEKEKTLYKNLLFDKSTFKSINEDYDESETYLTKYVKFPH